MGVEGGVGVRVVGEGLAEGDVVVVVVVVVVVIMAAEVSCRC